MKESFFVVKNLHLEANDFKNFIFLAFKWFTPVVI